MATRPRAELLGAVDRASSAAVTTDALVARAAEVLRRGGLVAFPTETVYGLGADALNPVAVQRVFSVKGRPADHPLIVHVGRAEELERVARDLPPKVWQLAARFWPGPLTLVVQKQDRVPLAVTGGRETIAVRIPNHPLALALIGAFGGPIAAPSANRFGRVSPTTRAHVVSDLGGEVDLILDGGVSEIGVESTIVDLTSPEPRVLRLGGISIEDLQTAFTQPIELELQGARAPGQLPSHYAPRARVLPVPALELARQALELRASGARVALLVPAGLDSPPELERIEVPAEPEGYARFLYAALRDLDQRAPDVILVVLPEAQGLGRTVADRIERAAAPRPRSSVED